MLKTHIYLYLFPKRILQHCKRNINKCTVVYHYDHTIQQRRIVASLSIKFEYSKVVLCLFYYWSNAIVVITIF